MTSDEGTGFDSDAFWEFARASGNFDEDSLDRMDAARAESKLNAEVADRRPSLAELGALLERHLELLSALVTVRRLEVLAEMERSGEQPEFLDDGVWLPATGAVALEDLEGLSGGWHTTLIKDEDHEDFSRAVRVARRLFEAAVDHLRAIALLVQDGSTVRAPLALTRIALDASAHLHHVLASDIDPPQRLIRALNEDLVVLSEAVRDAERSGAPRPTEEETAIDALLALVKEAAPQTHASWPPSQRPSGPRLGRVPYVDKFVGPSDMIDAALDAAGGALWANLSAVVHNQESQTFRVMFSLEISKNVRYREMNIASRVLAALFVLEQALKRLGPYMGWDLSDAVDPELLNLWGVAAGLADQLIRDEILKERSTES